MKPPEPSSEPPANLLESALKSLWGATAWPFRAATAEPLETVTFLDTLRRLEQCVAVQSSGVLWGPNGVEKSRLIQSLVQRLSPKLYRTLVLTHSSLTGSDVIRYITQELGLVTKPRRSDQVLALRQHSPDPARRGSTGLGLIALVGTVTGRINRGTQDGVCVGG